MQNKCTWCGRPDNDNTYLISSPDGTAFICSKCLEEARKKITEATTVEVEEPLSQKWKELTPSKIHAHLDQYIIGQERAKKVLSVAVYNHYKMLDNYDKKKSNDVEIETSSILLCGKTGTGKTAIIKALAKILDVPFAITDCTTLTQNGYVGADPESCIQRLLTSAKGDARLAERGIVYLDEFDKIALKGENMSITRDVSGEGVQQALLKIIEGTIVDVTETGTRRHPEASTTAVDTSNILFIVGGAFVGIEDIIKKRFKISNKSKIGFTDSKTDKIAKDVSFNDIIDEITTEDLKKYGIIPELLGRLPIITPLHDLSEQQLVQILTEPKNALVKQYQELFKYENVALKFEKDALLEIAARAIKNKTGARGLRAILENLLLDRMYTIPDKKDVKSLIITKADVENKEMKGEEVNEPTQDVSGVDRKRVRTGEGS